MFNTATESTQSVVSAIKDFFLGLVGKPEVRELPAESLCGPSGAYGSYIKLTDALGIKIIRYSESYDYAKLDQNYCKAELETQQRAHEILGDLVPKAYAQIPVKIGDCYYMGIVVQHVEGMTLEKYVHEVLKNAHVPQTDDDYYKWGQLVSQMLRDTMNVMRANGVIKEDHHSGNVMIGMDGKPKVIDWGLGMSEVMTEADNEFKHRMKHTRLPQTVDHQTDSLQYAGIKDQEGVVVRAEKKTKPEFRGLRHLIDEMFKHIEHIKPAQPDWFQVFKPEPMPVKDVMKLADQRPGGQPIQWMSGIKLRVKKDGVTFKYVEVYSKVDKAV